MLWFACKNTLASTSHYKPFSVNDQVNVAGSQVFVTLFWQSLCPPISQPIIKPLQMDSPKFYYDILLELFCCFLFSHFSLPKALQEGDGFWDTKRFWFRVDSGCRWMLQCSSIKTRSLHSSLMSNELRLVSWRVNATALEASRPPMMTLLWLSTVSGIRSGFPCSICLDHWLWLGLNASLRILVLVSFLTLDSACLVVSRMITIRRICQFGTLSIVTWVWNLVCHTCHSVAT